MAATPPDPNSTAALAAAMEKKLSEMFWEFSEVQKGAIHQEIVSVHKKIDSLNTRIEKVESNQGEASHVRHDKVVRNSEDEGSSRFHRFKMDPPVTDGTDPHTWLFKAKEFFEFNSIPDEKRLKVTGLMLDGAAVEWFRRMKRNNLINTWADFEEQFKFRFDPEMELRVNRPTTLNGAFALARETSAKYDELQTPIRRNWAPQGHRPNTANPSAQTAAITPYVPPTKTPLLATPKGIPARPIRRISLAEKSEKDAKGECYFCPEKWSRGHRCNGRYLLLVTSEGEADDEGLSVEAEAVIEGDVSVLQSLAGTTTPRSIRLKGVIEGQDVDVLVDGGSTHNFVHPKTAEKLRSALTDIDPFRVYVGNGDSLICRSRCNQVSMRVQNHMFTVDLFVLAVHGHNIVLGVQWLRSLGKITHDYSKMTMEFLWHDQPVLLCGEETPVKAISLQQLQNMQAAESIGECFELWT
ncbi:unnamed protein product, partial [Cuscuta campestris]